jgi:hypothetical protein
MPCLAELVDNAFFVGKRGLAEFPKSRKKRFVRRRLGAKRIRVSEREQQREEPLPANPEMLTYL